MLFDGIEMASGTTIQNVSVAYGTTFPTASLGELFFRTTDSILYVYTGTGWDKASGIPDVENKSSATIRSEITSLNVSDALGYVPLPESYAPVWTSIIAKPTTISGYGITNAYTKIEVDSAISAASVVPWANITGKPTLIANSGITDVYSKTEVNSAISASSSGGQTIRNTTPGVLTTAISPVRLYPSATMTLINVSASVTTSSTGADIKVDIRKNGTSILAGNLLTISIGSFKSAIIANTTQITSSDYITIHVTQVGTVVPGSDLVTSIYYV